MNEPMTTLDFMRDMRKQFGHFEFRAQNDKVIVTSTGWPVAPSHPANRPDSEYVIPALDLERMRLRKEGR